MTRKFGSGWNDRAIVGSCAARIRLSLKRMSRQDRVGRFFDERHGQLSSTWRCGTALAAARPGQGGRAAVASLLRILASLDFQIAVWIGVGSGDERTTVPQSLHVVWARRRSSRTRERIRRRHPRGEKRRSVTSVAIIVASRQFPVPSVGFQPPASRVVF